MKKIFIVFLAIALPAGPAFGRQPITSASDLDQAIKTLPLTPRSDPLDEFFVGLSAERTAAQTEAVEIILLVRAVRFYASGSPSEKIELSDASY